MKHCLHRTGVGQHHWTGGQDEYVCCHCGKKGGKPWRLVDQAIEGHGKFHTAKVKVYDECLFNLEECDVTLIT